MAQYGMLMAEALGYSKERKQMLEFACMLHDVGKLGIATEILNKDDQLSPSEMEKFKEHVQIGYFILNDIKHFKAIANIVRHAEATEVAVSLGLVAAFELTRQGHEVVVFDNLAGKLYLITHADPMQADAYTQGHLRLAALAEALAQVARDWEAESQRAEKTGARTVRRSSPGSVRTRRRCCRAAGRGGRTPAARRP